jgi:ribonuclease PH
LDLAYDEDSTAHTDMNVVMNDKGEFIEIQGTAENGSFSGDHLLSLTSLAKTGIASLIKAQKDALGL